MSGRFSTARAPASHVITSQALVIFPLDTSNCFNFQMLHVIQDCFIFKVLVNNKDILCFDF